MHKLKKYVSRKFGDCHYMTTESFMELSSELFCVGLTVPIVEGNGIPLQYSCLENTMDGGAWWATVHGVARRGTRLSDFTLSLCQEVGL